jgi:hypothetical protein
MLSIEFAGTPVWHYIIGLSGTMGREIFMYDIYLDGGEMALVIVLFSCYH